MGKIIFFDYPYSPNKDAVDEKVESEKKINKETKAKNINKKKNAALKGNL